MFTLYSADYINAPSNCSYPHKFEVTDTDSFAGAVSRDYVCAEYMNHYRNGDNFLGSDCLSVLCHSAPRIQEYYRNAEGVSPDA